MKHEQFQELVSLFIDRELDAGREQKLFGHLSDCEDCRTFLKAAMILQNDILDTKPSGVPSMALESLPKGRVLNRIWRKRVPFPIAATFAVLALASSVALTSFWMRPKEKPSEMTQEVVYVQRFPAIQVIGFYPPNGQSRK